MKDLTRAFPADSRTVARDHIERVLEERLTALSAGVAQAVAETLAAARRELTSKLNQSIRRLQAAETEQEWANAIVEATQGFSDRAAVFLIRDNLLSLAAARSIPGNVSATPLDSAAAFQSSVRSKDTVVALRTGSEMSDAIAKWAGEDPVRKFYLFPIIRQERVAALLYADSAGHNLETSGLELLTTVAAAVFKPRSFGHESRPALVTLGASAISPEQQDLHLQAQRFALTQVAGIRLYKSENVKNGRAGRDLYASLKAEIDSARQTYQQEYLSAPGNMVDYLHLELVRTLANDDVELLGPDYPGPLV